MRRTIFTLTLIWISAFTAYAGAPAAKLNWSQVQKETLSLLQKLIQADTRNPPGNELRACKVLADFLDREGIEYHIYKVEKGRANLLARIHGNGDQKPILFVAHTDVVPFEESEWSFPPLKGVIQDGYLYGRGAIDNKGMLAVEAMTLALLKRQNVPLRRDVILLVTAGEEAGGGVGMGWMVDKHRAELEAAFAINEGGRIVMRNGEPVYVGLEVEEKMAYNIKVIALGTSGHAAVPRLDNPILSLAKALVRLETYSNRQVLDPVTEAFFKGIAPIDTTIRWIKGQVQTDNPLFLSMLTNTISPTIIEGGAKSNVLPARASANLNCRLLPGQDVGEFVDSLKSRISPGPYEFEYNRREPAPPPSPTNGSGYILLEQVCRELFPEAPVVPYLSPGMSDATRLRRAGIPTYGLVPFPLSEDDAWRTHGKDERVSLEALLTGLHLMYQLATLAGK